MLQDSAVDSSGTDWLPREELKELAKSAAAAAAASSQNNTTLNRLKEPCGPHGQGRCYKAAVCFTTIDRMTVSNVAARNIPNTFAHVASALEITCKCTDFPQASYAKAAREEAKAISNVLNMLLLYSCDWTLIIDKTPNRFKEYVAFVALVCEPTSKGSGFVRRVRVLSILEQRGGTTALNMQSLQRWRHDATTSLQCYYEQLGDTDPRAAALETAGVAFSRIVAGLSNRGAADFKFLLDLKPELATFAATCKVTLPLPPPHPLLAQEAAAQLDPSPTTATAAAGGHARVRLAHHAAAQVPAVSAVAAVRAGSQGEQGAAAQVGTPAVSAVAAVGAGSQGQQGAAAQVGTPAFRRPAPCEYRFFCGCHFANSMAELVVKVIMPLESVHFGSPPRKLDVTEMQDKDLRCTVVKGGLSSGVSREAMKLFHPWSADGRCGAPAEFIAFVGKMWEDSCHQRGSEPMPLRLAGGQPQDGKRFAIHLTRARATAIMSDPMLTFLEHQQRLTRTGQCMNMLKQAVYLKLSVDQNIDSLLAAGLLELLIIGPLLDTFQQRDKTMHHLDLCPVFAALLDRLDTLAGRPDFALPPISSRQCKPLPQQHL